MNLVLGELIDTLETELRTDHLYHLVRTVRPHLLRYGAPAGTVKMQIRDAEDTLIAESAARSIAAIGVGTYWHGFANFDVVAHLMPDTVYTFKLVPAGYSFSESGYVGWCNSYDLSTYEATYANVADSRAPLGIEIWSRKVIRKGAA